MKVRTETTIDRPPEEVFAYLVDLRNDPDWCPRVDSVEQVGGDGPGPGARYRAVHRPKGGKQVPLDLEVLEVEAPRRLLMRQDDEAGIFLTTYELTPTSGGGTRLAQTSDMRFRGAARIAAPLIKLAVRKGTREQFRALTALLGGDRPTPRREG